jgi:hypothetical protein
MKGMANGDHHHVLPQPGVRMDVRGYDGNLATGGSGRTWMQWSGRPEAVASGQPVIAVWVTCWKFATGQRFGGQTASR